MAVVTQNQSYFIDLFFHNSSFMNYLFGTHHEKPITFIVGEIYYNSQTANINTNAFFYALLENGIFGYALSLFAISSFFMLLDVFYEKYKIREFLAIATIYSLLLSEQAYTTAFISSGVGFVFFVFILFRYKQKHYSKEKL